MPPIAAPPFDPEQILAVLHRHGVDYVLIGGLAAFLQGSPLATTDADICPARTAENLTRLTAALAELQAMLRVEGTEGVPIDLDTKLLSEIESLTLVTRFGNLDVLPRPAGTNGYEELRQRAIAMDLENMRVLLASVPDIVHMKALVGTPKDQRDLPTLRALIEEIERRKGE